MEEKRKQAVLADWLLFAVALAGYTVLMFTLFHWQTCGNQDYYRSDMEAYILEMQGLESGYEFPYPLFFKFSALLYFLTRQPELAVALATTILNSLSPLALKWYMNGILLRECEANGAGKRLKLGVLITAVVMALFFVSMLFPPKGIYLPNIQNHYMGVFSPNPFHNATYLATRPFAIIVFFLFGRLLTEYEVKTDWKSCLLFSLFLFLTTITKPSFTFAMVPTAGIIMLYRLIKSKGHNFIPSLRLGICFIPTFAALLYQYKGVFAASDAGEGGIGFGLATAWKMHCHNIPLAIGVALGFPLLVLLLNFRELKTDKWYRFSWQLLLVSLAEVFFLYEKGFRMSHLNFSWSYMHGLFFVFVGSSLVLIRKTWRKQGPWWLTAVQWLAFVWHLACGIYYFLEVFQGQLYY